MKGRKKISLTIARLRRSQGKEGEQKPAAGAQQAQKVVLAAEQTTGKIKNGLAGIGGQQQDV